MLDCKLGGREWAVKRRWNSHVRCWFDDSGVARAGRERRVDGGRLQGRPCRR